MSIRNALLVCCVLLGLVVTAPAQERVDLGSPVTTTQTGWDITSMVLDVEKMRIIVRLRGVGNPSITLEKTYDGQVGDTLLRNLNKANLSTRSLLQRTYDRLIADGVISGTVEGTPR